MKKNLLFLLIPFSVFIFPLLLDIFHFNISQSIISEISNIFTRILLPISFIIYVILLVEYDIRRTGRKRRSYIFAYLIYLPIFVILLIYGITLS
ncbi:MAG: hypothetical protein HRT42_07960 [Campylobacteraceae bacterium]|nr:hypothetical protein [Campylobacteraceae bacterium]